jgi:hypothetical protein
MGFKSHSILCSTCSDRTEDSMPEKRKKSRYEIKLRDEKRAFVVIALTDKLSLPGKAAAANALAHYDSRKGYAWASVEKMTRESGYAPTSTKTLNRGLLEIHAKGAFKVVRTKGGATNTHHICPNMSWFRAEYELLRKSGRVEEDKFADIRDDDQEEDNSGSQPEVNSGSEQKNSGSGLDNSGSQPNNPGSGPDEEDSTKKTPEEDQKKRATPREQAPASGERRPAGGLVDDDRPQSRPANDNAEIEPWPDDIVDKFQTHYPKGGDRSKIAEALEEIRREGKTEFRDLLRGASNYKRERTGAEPKYVKNPENFVKERLWTGYQRDNRPPLKMAAAI